jgi:hypothetical protein
MGFDRSSLTRFLRACAVADIVRETELETFTLTPTWARCLAETGGAGEATVALRGLLDNQIGLSPDDMRRIDGALLMSARGFRRTAVARTPELRGSARCREAAT